MGFVILIRELNEADFVVYDSANSFSEAENIVVQCEAQDRKLCIECEYKILRSLI